MEAVNENSSCDAHEVDDSPTYRFGEELIHWVLENPLDDEMTAEGKIDIQDFLESNEFLESIYSVVTSDEIDALSCTSDAAGADQTTSEIVDSQRQQSLVGAIIGESVAIDKPSKKRSSLSGGPSRRSSKKKPKGFPKRPLSAYNLFFKSERLKILQEGALDHHRGTSFEELGKQIGHRWQNLNATKRKEYAILSEEDATRYRNEMDAYDQSEAPTAKGSFDPKASSTLYPNTLTRILRTISEELTSPQFTTNACASTETNPSHLVTPSRNIRTAVNVKNIHSCSPLSSKDTGTHIDLVEDESSRDLTSLNQESEEERGSWEHTASKMIDSSSVVPTGSASGRCDRDEDGAHPVLARSSSQPHHPVSRHEDEKDAPPAYGPPHEMSRYGRGFDYDIATRMSSAPPVFYSRPAHSRGHYYASLPPPPLPRLYSRDPPPPPPYFPGQYSPSSPRPLLHSRYSDDSPNQHSDFASMPMNPYWDRTLPTPQENILLRDPKTGLERYYKMEYKCYRMARSEADAYMAQCCGSFQGGRTYMPVDRMLHAPTPPGTEVQFSPDRLP